MVLAQKLQTAAAVWSLGEMSPARIIGGGSATVAELGHTLHGVGTLAFIARGRRCERRSLGRSSATTTRRGA
jgi:hypothetical protein